MIKETLASLTKTRCALVVVAGGKGTRFGGFKQLAPIAGIPLLVRTLQAFEDKEFSEHILVLPQEFLEGGETYKALTCSYPFLKTYQTVCGGEMRADSVLAGVTVASTDSELVAVHDGARPFPPFPAIDRCVEALVEDEGLAGAIVTAPMADTVKMVAEGGKLIQSTVDRELLRRAETPQIGRRELLLSALQAPGARHVSDEAHALEKAGHRVAAITHEGFNPKITMRHDIMVAERYLESLKDTET